MKKRTQIPDSYTYTLLLRGLAEYADHRLSVPRALSLYHSMDSPNSKVRRQIIHTNAALKVCARANDMDALWGIAGKIPEKGAGAADARTYTTVLNAIRTAALAESKKSSSSEECIRIKDTAVVQGRRIWDEVIRKWRSADILIDEELVCTMGRLLLIGSHSRDWNDVLSLVEQTTAVSRYAPLPLLDSGEDGVPRLHDRTDSLVSKTTMLDRQSENLGDSVNDLATSPPHRVSTSKETKSSTDSVALVRPSNNMLSLILEACQKISAGKSASKYWNLLVSPKFGIIPDRDNVHHLLRIYRLGRASRSALHLLQSEPVSHLHLNHATFRLAMSACARNKTDIQTFATATQLVSLMDKHLGNHPDSKVLAMFSDLALSRKDKMEMLSAVASLEPVVEYMQTICERNSASDNDRHSQDDALDVLKSLQSVLDRLALEHDLSPSHLKLRTELITYIRKHIEGRRFPKQ
jgi:hypothetical protein